MVYVISWRRTGSPTGFTLLNAQQSDHLYTSTDHMTKKCFALSAFPKMQHEEAIPCLCSVLMRLLGSTLNSPKFPNSKLEGAVLDHDHKQTQAILDTMTFQHSEERVEQQKNETWFSDELSTWYLISQYEE
jgi:hypothetical protein